MKLTLSMIIEQLQGLSVRETNLRPRDFVTSVRFAQSDVKMEAEILYVSLQDGGSLCRTRAGSSFSVATDNQNLFNQLLHAFEVYGEWEKQLQLACARGCTLTELLDLSYPIISHPLAILDSNQWYVGSSTAFLGVPFNEDWIDMQQLHTTKPEKIQAFNQSYHDCFNNKFLYRIPGHVFSGTGYAMNLFRGNQFAGIVLLADYQTELTQGELDRFSLLCEQIQSLINIPGNNVCSDFSDQALAQFLSDDSEEAFCKLESMLKRSLWEDTDPKTVVFAKPTVDSSLAPTPSHSKIIFSRMEGICVMDYRDGLVFLCNERILRERIANLGLQGIMQPDGSGCLSVLQPWLAQISYCGGISFSFTDLRGFHRHFRQASIALEFGTHTPGAMNACQDYILPYVFDILRKEDTGMLEHPCLEQLRQYDKHYGSSLFRTLFVYLKNERSQTATAVEMHIHRSTLIHRLDKLKELLGEQLEDPHVRMHILISYYLNEEK